MSLDCTSNLSSIIIVLHLHDESKYNVLRSPTQPVYYVRNLLIPVKITTQILQKNTTGLQRPLDHNGCPKALIPLSMYRRQKIVVDLFTVDGQIFPPALNWPPQKGVKCDIALLFLFSRWI